MTKMGIFSRALAAFAALLVACMLLSSCSVNPKFEVEGKKQNFSGMSREELDKYLTVGKYKGMEISLDGRTAEEAVWDAILKNCDVHDYPSEHVYYYKNQLEAQYRYYADLADISYKEMLKQLGENDATILRDAKSMTKKDIAYAVIVKLENISVSEEEKASYFDEYVSMYVGEYGYDEKYVRSNMSELIYDSMLYDKTTKFLISSNTVSE